MSNPWSPNTINWQALGNYYETMPFSGGGGGGGNPLAQLQQAMGFANTLSSLLGGAGGAGGATAAASGGGDLLAGFDLSDIADLALLA
jgi:hypothetical protein